MVKKYSKKNLREGKKLRTSKGSMTSKGLRTSKGRRTRRQRGGMEVNATAQQDPTARGKFSFLGPTTQGVQASVSTTGQPPLRFPAAAAAPSATREGNEVKATPQKKRVVEVAGTVDAVSVAQPNNIKEAKDFIEAEGGSDTTLDQWGAMQRPAFKTVVNEHKGVGGEPVLNQVFDIVKKLKEFESDKDIDQSEKWLQDEEVTSKKRWGIGPSRETYTEEAIGDISGECQGGFKELTGKPGFDLLCADESFKEYILDYTFDTPSGIEGGDSCSGSKNNINEPKCWICGETCYGPGLFVKKPAKHYLNKLNNSCEHVFPFKTLWQILGINNSNIDFVLNTVVKKLEFSSSADAAAKNAKIILGKIKRLRSFFYLSSHGICNAGGPNDEYVRTKIFSGTLPSLGTTPPEYIKIVGGKGESYYQNDHQGGPGTFIKKENFPTGVEPLTFTLQTCSRGKSDQDWIKLPTQANLTEDFENNTIDSKINTTINNIFKSLKGDIYSEAFPNKTYTFPAHSSYGVHTAEDKLSNIIQYLCNILNDPVIKGIVKDSIKYNYYSYTTSILFINLMKMWANIIDNIKPNGKNEPTTEGAIKLKEKLTELITSLRGAIGGGDGTEERRMQTNTSLTGEGDGADEGQMQINSSLNANFPKNFPDFIDFWAEGADKSRDISWLQNELAPFPISKELLNDEKYIKKIINTFMGRQNSKIFILIKDLRDYDLSPAYIGSEWVGGVGTSGIVKLKCISKLKDAEETTGDAKEEEEEELPEKEFDIDTFKKNFGPSYFTDFIKDTTIGNDARPWISQKDLEARAGAEEVSPFTFGSPTGNGGKPQVGAFTFGSTTGSGEPFTFGNPTGSRDSSPGEPFTFGPTGGEGFDFHSSVSVDPDAQMEADSPVYASGPAGGGKIKTNKKKKRRNNKKNRTKKKRNHKRI